MVFKYRLSKEEMKKFIENESVLSFLDEDGFSALEKGYITLLNGEAIVSYELKKNKDGILYGVSLLVNFVKGPMFMIKEVVQHEKVGGAILNKILELTESRNREREKKAIEQKKIEDDFINRLVNKATLL